MTRHRMLIVSETLGLMVKTTATALGPGRPHSRKMCILCGDRGVRARRVSRVSLAPHSSLPKALGAALSLSLGSRARDSRFPDARGVGSVG